MSKAFRAVVRGIVQGVSFRYYTRKEAVSLGLRGSVMNLPDGTVEVWATGDETSLKELADWLRIGPAHAFVDKLELKWQSPDESFDNFSIRY